jgi:hypothetical protein
MLCIERSPLASLRIKGGLMNQIKRFFLIMLGIEDAPFVQRLLTYTIFIQICTIILMLVLSWLAD